MRTPTSVTSWWSDEHPSGGEPVAIVSLLGDVPDEELLATAAEHIARYKLPKAFLRVEQVVRSPSGKADYRWAKEQVGG